MKNLLFFFLNHWVEGYLIVKFMLNTIVMSEKYLLSLSLLLYFTFMLKSIQSLFEETKNTTIFNQTSTFKLKKKKNCY